MNILDCDGEKITFNEEFDLTGQDNAYVRKFVFDFDQTMVNRSEEEKNALKKNIMLDTLEDFLLQIYEKNVVDTLVTCLIKENKINLFYTVFFTIISNVLNQHKGFRITYKKHIKKVLITSKVFHEHNQFVFESELKKELFVTVV